MTMFTLPNFCRVCLKYDKNLIDLAHIENEPSETLMNKLQHCVSEVEWTIFKPLLCHPCIKKLNIAYSFKKQCVQSAGVLKNYIELVKESQKKNESQNTVKAEGVIPTTGGAYMLLPNQKYVKILVGGQNQTTNTFQNVFLNLIPASSLNSVVTPNLEASNGIKTKDTNQNVFLNLNNTFSKFIPVSQVTKTPPEPEKPPNLTVNQILTESKSEELSVEIDPTVFELEEDETVQNEEEEEVNDYDEVITKAKIDLKDGKLTNGVKVQNGKQEEKHFVPILPKNTEDFISSGQHFLFSSSESSGTFKCESCQKTFSTKKYFKAHLNQFHLGKSPFKCQYCYLEFLTRKEYELCLKTHKIETESSLNKSITLQDFTTNSTSLTDLQLSDIEALIQPSENGEYNCDVCRRPFTSSTGLLRHKVRKHNQKNKKKYFIKGMKNAKCDICNREFSTQSYMQLHKKLHLRDDIGYKYKVFGKSKYGDIERNGQQIKDEEADEKVESLDVTPDIFTEDDSNEEKYEDPSTSTDRNTSKMELDQENDTEDDEEEEEDSKLNKLNIDTDVIKKGEESDLG
ncbi:myoneurin-like isoform X2 [Diorhabda sublineata]|uniref:myoneurin-like isoform X2 n=1 Tax=Diorhabda sublineata TaxID=1163346 RepID=UPI0024E0C873|nr:myoneurin-like isoform X2 [Diorhabda sublineata]